MRTSFSIDEKQFAEAMRNYGEVTRRSDTEVVNKAAKYLVSFAINKIPRADKGKIENELMAGVTRSSRIKFTKAGKIKKVGKNESIYKGTVAAAIIAKRIKARGGEFPTTGKFYGNVGKFIKTRARTSGYIRSGLFPALTEFSARIKRGGITIRKPPGRASKATDGQKRATAIIINRAKGVETVAGRAFSTAMPEVTRQLVKWTNEAINKNARKANLN